MILCGFLFVFQTYTCAVIPEEDLEVYKNSLTSVNCVHVYSVQKGSLKVCSPVLSIVINSLPFISFRYFNFIYVKMFAFDIKAGEGLNFLQVT